MSGLDINTGMQNIGNGLKDTGTQIMNTVAGIMKKNPEEQLVELIILMMIALVVVIFVFWAYSLTTLQDKDCANLDKIYASNNENINPIANYNPYNNIPFSQYSPTNFLFDPSGGNARVFSYYVKTAYNCCSPGNFSNSFVSICALRHAISLGARCLDFEIYSLDLEPVISTTTQSSDLVSSFYIKETFNSLKLSDALYYIKYFALESSSGGATNFSDPLFLHFRIMTRQEKTINLIAKYLIDILSDHLLGSNYGQNNYGGVLSNHSILEFCGKCVIMVNNNPVNSADIMSSDLWPLTNILTGSDNYKLLRYSSVKFMGDDETTELISNNKYGITMVLPDSNSETTNFDPRICLRTGCQFIAMNFQTFDEYLKTYFTVFGETGFSFVLKPCSLRWIPVHYMIKSEGLQSGLACSAKATNDGTTIGGGHSGGG